MAAKLALAVELEVIRSKQIASDQQLTVDTLQAAVDRHEKSVLDLAAAQASREDARPVTLAFDPDLFGG